jgi:hypothetical protein
MDTSDLEILLKELKDKIPTAVEANDHAEQSVIPYARSILEGLAEQIKYKVNRNEKSLVTDIRINLDSPVLSLTVAVIRKLGYNIRCDSINEGVQVSINWNV